MLYTVKVTGTAWCALATIATTKSSFNFFLHKSIHRKRSSFQRYLNLNLNYEKPDFKEPRKMILVIEKEECRVWDRKELSIYKRLSETEYGWSAEVKQEGEWYTMSLEGRQVTVHTYRQAMYAMMKEGKKKDFLPRTMGRYRRVLS